MPYNSLTEVIERDYNLNVLRHKKTTYLKILNGVDYAGLNVTSTLALHLRDLPLQESIFGPSGEESRVTYEYDNYNTDANHAPLVSRPNISGLDSAFTTSYVTRGNVTGRTQYFLSSGTVTGSVSSYMQYDVAGNVVKVIDERGNATTFAFADGSGTPDNFGAPNGEARTSTRPSELSGPNKYAYAFPVKITNPLGHTVYSQVDYYTGKTVDMEDPNGIASSAYFADSLDRPTQTIVAANNPSLKTQTTISYDDTNRVITSTSDLSSYGDNLKKEQQLVDGLGRTTERRHYEGTTNYVATRYTTSGLVNKTSNPFRPSQGETVLWNTVVMDALSRVISVTTADNASVTTTYAGNTMTVRSQHGPSEAGTKRKLVSDSIGRLKGVYEDPDGLNYQTIYGYDARNHLISVLQQSASQAVRTFAYDSLGRMVSATNPESGTVTYQYDAVGNLIVKTDARSDPADQNKKVSVHLSYDAINRLTRHWYNASSLTTATTHNSPALPAFVGATDEGHYYYDSQTLPSGAPTFTRGASIGSLVALTYGGSSATTGDYFGRDPIGRQVLKIQRTGSTNYQLSLNYNAVGGIQSLTYPSGHTVNYTYDNAGRLSSLSGNLGDGSFRTYSTGILYSPFNGLVKEQFGTTTAVYNKLFYNSRGQLSEIRAATTYSGPTDTSWNRGAIVNHYSDQCAGMCGGHNSSTAMTDNTGLLKKQEVYIPNDDQISGYTLRWQQFNYDSLNRLKWVREVIGGTEQWKQAFTYDRFGNRTIDTALTYGTGINNKLFSVQTTTNRLVVPSGQTGAMTYDAVGSLTNDTYTGAGARVYNAENKITSAAGGQFGQAQLYKYDGGGHRIKRTIDGVETWAVYGFSDEMLAEYPVNGPLTNPQKEYGYRNGQLLVTADGRTNVALAANGAVASASSAHTCCGFSVGGAINGNIRGPWSDGEGWNDATENVLPDWFQVDFAGSKTIDQIDVFSLHDNYTEQNTPTDTQTFSLHGLVNFQVQYWNGSAWTLVPGGNVTGNNKVWRKFIFTPITTNKIRLWITGVPDSWSRLVELQAWAADAGMTNLALNKPATQSTTDWGAPATRGVDGNTDGNFANNSVTHTATQSQPWWQVDLQSVSSIQNINVWNRTDCCGEALTNFYVFVSDNPFTANDVASTQSQAGVSTYFVTGLGGVPSTIAVNRTGRYVRVQLGGTERLSVAEVQVFGGGGGQQVRWLVSDHLGSARMVLDKTGSLANVKRHDYLPFGEELFSGTAGRSASQGYAAGDNVRQQFTGQEKDTETGLNYFLTRYYSPTQGRFTSIDPNNAGVALDDPQTWNAYTYTRNTPTIFVDPDGRSFQVCYNKGETCYEYSDKQFYQIVQDAISLGAVVRNGKIYNEVNGQLQVTAEYVRTDTSAMWDSVAPELSKRLEPIQKVVEVGFEIDVAIITFGTSLGPVGTTTLELGEASFAGVAKATSKLDYVFGKATGELHNIQRSQSMAAQLSKIGIRDTAEMRRYVLDHILKAFKNPGIIQQNGRVMRESLLWGPGGAVKVQSVWEGDMLITIILK